MKKIIHLILFPVILFVSCISDNMDDCAATRTLYFKHYCLYDPDESFDTKVGNDVLLYIFQDKALKMKEIIPYERIKDGKSYSYPKRYGGDIDIVAWAVPKGSATAIPQYEIGAQFNDQRVVHQKGTANYNTFPVDLFLGTDSLKNDVVTESTAHVIRMIHCANLVKIIIDDPEGKLQSYTNHYVLVEGVMEQMDLRYGGCGQEAVVRDGVEGATTFESDYFGVLPSAAKQKLSFTLYGDDKPLAIVTTEQKAVSGGRIEIKIILGVSVSITVNNADWDVYTSVQWL